MIKIGSQCDGEVENCLAVIKKDSLRDQNWFVMIKIGSQCDGEMENRHKGPDQLRKATITEPDWKHAFWMDIRVIATQARSKDIAERGKAKGFHIHPVSST